MKRAAGPARFRAVCAYDGGMFHGWQSQINARSVQDGIEAGLERILGVKTRIHGSGRTDTGVHAIAQVFHFDAEWPRPASVLALALATRVPKGVQIKSITRARPTFHARFDAKGKRYHYRIFLGVADPFETALCWSLPKGADVDAMRAAAAILQGKHDFAAFTADNGDERETTVRDLRRLDVRRTGRRVRVTLEADGFLYKMARSLVGAIVAVGCGRLSLDVLKDALATGRRIPAIATAPAHGLFLERVFYT